MTRPVLARLVLASFSFALVAGVLSRIVIDPFPPINFQKADIEDYAPADRWWETPTTTEAASA